MQLARGKFSLARSLVWLGYAGAMLVVLAGLFAEGGSRLTARSGKGQGQAWRGSARSRKTFGSEGGKRSGGTFQVI